MGSIAARQAREIIDIAERAAAIHLIASAQAADLRGVGGLGETRRAYDIVRSVCPALEDDRAMDVDIESVVALLRSGAFAGL